MTTTTVQHHPQTSTPADTVARVLSRAPTRLSEGPHPWGTIDVTPTGRASWNRTRQTSCAPRTRLNDHGLLSAAEYEIYWAEIYDALPATSLS